jgi:cytoskeletal protein CcmA (bactofilin family)
MKTLELNKDSSSDIIATVIGRGTYVKGSIRLKNSGRIDGHIIGDVNSDQDVLIGESGIVEGSITARSAVIGGKVQGAIEAEKRVILEEKAELEGDIHTGHIRIVDGARFNGKCYMVKETDKGKPAQ